MIKVDNGKYFFVGPKGKIPLCENDEISLKLAMRRVADDVMELIGGRLTRE